jgi:hypothetical protein
MPRRATAQALRRGRFWLLLVNAVSGYENVDGE